MKLYIFIMMLLLLVGCAEVAIVSIPTDRFETPQSVVVTDRGNVVFKFLKWKSGEEWNYGIKVMWFDVEGLRTHRPEFKKDGLEILLDADKLQLAQFKASPKNHRSLASVDEVWSTEEAEFHLSSQEAFELSQTKSVKFVLKGKNFDVPGIFDSQHLKTMQDFLAVRVEK